jgi:hypothetical protein
MRPRSQDWPEQLAAFIEARRATPFAWGQQDCCLFAADALLAMGTEDLAAPWRGTYRSARGAKRALQAAGGMEQLVSDALQSQPRAALLAQRGDVVLMDMPAGPTLGVCLGAHVAAPGADGLVFEPLASARLRMCWSV